MKLKRFINVCFYLKYGGERRNICMPKLFQQSQGFIFCISYFGCFYHVGLNLQIRLILKALSKHLFCLWKISVFLQQYFEDKMDTFSDNQSTMQFFWGLFKYKNWYSKMKQCTKLLFLFPFPTAVLLSVSLLTHKCFFIYHKVTKIIFCLFCWACEPRWQLWVCCMPRIRKFKQRSHIYT